MTYQDKISGIIVRLKKYRENHPEFTLQRISDHTGVSFSTVSRIFADDSENVAFRYESISPIAKYLLDIDDLSEGNDDEIALKSILKYMESTIEELKYQKAIDKKEFAATLEKERAESRKTIEFLMKQIEVKDETIRDLAKVIDTKESQNSELNALMNKIVGKLLENKELITELLG